MVSAGAERMKLWSLGKVFFILPSVNGRQVSLVLLAGVFRAGKEQTWDQADPSAAPVEGLEKPGLC